MRIGKMLNSGDVVLANIQFTDTFEIKKRPCVIIFEEFDNIIVAGITSNKNMKGIKLTKQDGAIKDSVIKTNYIFTLSEKMIEKKLFTLNKTKKSELKKNLINKINNLN
jgi:mRNA interferase MazF